MPTAIEKIPDRLLSLWPKLKRSLRVIENREGRGGIIFISSDDQSLIVARAVAKSLGRKTFELPAKGLKKEVYDKQIGKLLDGSIGKGTASFRGIDRLTIVIPRIDKQPQWFRLLLKAYCDGGGSTVAFLATCPDLDWMESSLRGHLLVCRKKGASRNTDARPGSVRTKGKIAAKPKARPARQRKLF
jgi:hypothetical protein